MTEAPHSLKISVFDAADTLDMIALWQRCGLVVPWNNPRSDIERKLSDSPELFFSGKLAGDLVASCMAGYDGHRGWIYYLAVDPVHRRSGFAARLVAQAETRLAAIGCPKIDLMVRDSNVAVIDFYRSIGYQADPVKVLSKRLLQDDEHEFD